MKVLLLLALTACIDVAVSQMWDAVGPGTPQGGRGGGRGGGETLVKLCGTVTCPPGTQCVKHTQLCGNPPCPPVEECISNIPREGTCPKELPHNSMMDRGGLKCVQVCDVDEQCISGRKCCPYGCKRLCRKTVEYVKDGQCPISNNIPPKIKCTDLTGCQGDGDCFWKKKCCLTDRCGKKCLMPEFPNSKPGQCPLHTLVSTKQANQTCPVDTCATDVDCPTHDKCCGRCPRQCISPMRSIREGSCPQENNGTNHTQLTCPTPDQCTVDLECPSGEKCCGSCPQKCTKPVLNPAAAFACPISSIYDTSMTCVLLPRCLSDKDCKSQERCCLTPCGLSCIVDVPANTGPVNNLPNQNGQNIGVGQQGQNALAPAFGKK